jgi:hypothetical protein
MFVARTLLQIVPLVPGGIDGVGDYALTVSRRLRDEFGCETTFAAFNAGSAEDVSGFDVVPLETLPDDRAPKFDNILLHYVNYGFQKRGVPFRLMSILSALRKQHRGKLITIFHELYASGPPWQSAFWLQPLQIHLAKRVARLSDSCIVSSESFLRQVKRLAPSANVELHPVPSTFGEPSLSAGEIANRDPHQWAIIGGNVLLERSLRSLSRLRHRIPDSIAPRKLNVIGGHESAIIRSLIAALGVESVYRPSVAANDASNILRTCAYVWFDYFHRPDVESSVILKSSAFASACAHAAIPVFPHPGSPISIEGDQLAGPFFISHDKKDVPTPENRAAIAQSIHNWYQRHASSGCLSNALAEMLQ